jgi:DNA-binding beta-propeller fold protein YncE
MVRPLGFTALALCAPLAAGAGTLVDPAGEIEAIVGDPVRDRYYLSLATNEVVVVEGGGTVGPRVAVAGDPGELAVARDGSVLYVALESTHDVAVYALPAVTYLETYDLSATTGPTGLVAGPGRLYAVSNEGLSIVDTADGDELYFDEPVANAFYASVLALSPDGRRLYAQDTGLSPATLELFDVSTVPPTYLGDDCAGLGSNGRQVALSPDGARAYVATGGTYYVQVLGTGPLLHPEQAALTGPYPNAIAVATNGSRIFVGYQDAEFAIVRTSDWLPFHVGTLEGRVMARGLALSSNQNRLAAAIEYQGFDPNRVELVNVTAPVANRGGVRARPLDTTAGIPIVGASFQDPPFEGASAFVEVAAGRVARAPIPPGPLTTDLSAPGHTTLELGTTIVAGSWSDLGDRPMVRTGSMPPPSAVCVTPAVAVGATQRVRLHGRGFQPGAGLAVTSNDGDLAIDDFDYVNWATIDATVTVSAVETPGLKVGAVRVTNPDAQLTGGTILIKDALFADSFESADLSRWSAANP